VIANFARVQRENLFKGESKRNPTLNLKRTKDHIRSPQMSCFKDRSKVLEMFLFSVLMHE